MNNSLHFALPEDGTIQLYRNMLETCIIYIYIYVCVCVCVCVSMHGMDNFQIKYNRRSSPSLKLLFVSDLMQHVHVGIQ